MPGRAGVDVVLPLERYPSEKLRGLNMMARAKKLTKDLLRASTGRLGDTFCSPSTKLVIFSRGRTGSNLLVSLLRSHPQIWHHHEIFGEYYLQHDFIRNEVNKLGPWRILSGSCSACS